MAQGLREKIKVSNIVHAKSYVTLHYRISIDSGEGRGQVFIETFSSNPATLQMGAGQWLANLEQPLIGLKEGDLLTFHVVASQAYGDRNPDLLIYLTREMLIEHAGEEVDFNADDVVEFAAPNGSKYSGVFKHWEGEKALFDFNHPLSGLDLKVDVEILGVI
ncbi:MAG: peptidylprolyl isomerase [Alcaligenaceae bacterium]|nr:peptidylprolyl isomerase [Alcaligenaceae bacterium]